MPEQNEGTILGIDIGGSKTLLAVFDQYGELKNKLRFETPKEYADFLVALKENYTQLQLPQEPQKTVVAIPGRLDKSTGSVLGYGTLKWPPAPVQHDIEKALGLSIIIENDAKLAGLSEAILIKDEFKKALYMTISTGIGTAIITDGVIPEDFSTDEGGQILIQDGDKVKQWEDVASGKAIREKYGKLASELDDPKAWESIARFMAIGIIDLIAVFQPDVIIIGGGVGTHFSKYKEPLLASLKKYETPLTPIPPIRQAKHPEEAVIYGCYELATQNHGSR